MIGKILGLRRFSAASGGEMHYTMNAYSETMTV